MIFHIIGFCKSARRTIGGLVIAVPAIALQVIHNLHMLIVVVLIHHLIRAEFKNRLAVLEDLVLHIVSHSAPELVELLRPRFPNELQAARAARPGPCFVNKPVLVGRFCGRGAPDKRAVVLTIKVPIIGIKIAAYHATPSADISAAPVID